MTAADAAKLTQKVLAGETEFARELINQALQKVELAAKKGSYQVEFYPSTRSLHQPKQVLAIVASYLSKPNMGYSVELKTAPWDPREQSGGEDYLIISWDKK